MSATATAAEPPLKMADPAPAMTFQAIAVLSPTIFQRHMDLVPAMRFGDVAVLHPPHIPISIGLVVAPGERVTTREHARP